MNMLNDITNLYILIALFVGVGLLIITIIANCILFKKAGKKVWEALLPFYNTWVLVEIAELNWWWFLLASASELVLFVNDNLTGIASIVSLVANFNCYYNLAKKFGKSNSTSVLSGIFSGIFIFIFAFSKNEKYCANIKVNPNGIFSSDNNSDMSKETNNEPLKYCTNCGCKIEENHKFCAICGNKLK